jgi:serine/threonine-protein kinase
MFGLSAGIVMYFALRGRTVEVPDLIGKTQEEAETELEDYGLRMQVKSRAYHDKLPPNAVSDQVPAPGTVVKTGQLVRVSLSSGPPPTAQR